MTTSHPLRPAKTAGIVYQCPLPDGKRTLSLRTMSPETDLPHFHDWMNQERVDFFWEEKGTRAAHLQYLTNKAAEAHTHALIACVDNTPFAYIEVYWCQQDRIAPYYDVEPYDRGMHLLAGKTQKETGIQAGVWIRALVHHLFNEDARTQRLIGEPRVDNVGILAIAKRVGFAKIKEFDFPHKRAALLILERTAYFESHGTRA